MLKKRTYKLSVISDFPQLLVHVLLQFFAFQQRSSGHIRALDMILRQFVGIEVWRIAWQEVQRETTLRANHIFLGHRFLVRRQTIHHQTQPLLAAIYRLFERFNKQFTRKTALIGGKSECAFAINCGSCADALALPRPVNHRCLATKSPCLAVHHIGVSLISTLQGLLRPKVGLDKQAAHRGHAQAGSQIVNFISDL